MKTMGVFSASLLLAFQPTMQGQMPNDLFSVRYICDTICDSDFYQLNLEECTYATLISSTYFLDDLNFGLGAAISCDAFFKPNLNGWITVVDLNTYDFSYIYLNFEELAISGFWKRNTFWPTIRSSCLL